MDQKKCNVKYPHIDQQIKTLIDVSEKISDTDIFIEIAIDRFDTKIERSAYPEFIRRSLVLFNREESFEVHEKYWSFVAKMIISRNFTLSLFRSEYCRMLEETRDKDIDSNVLWIYKAEILKTLIIRGAYPLKDLLRTTSGLKKRGLVGKLVGNLLKILVESEGKTSITEKWNESGIEWKDLFDKSLEDPDDIIKEYDLQFLTFGETDQLSKRLLKLLRENSPHDKTWIIKNWITKNVVEEKIKKPKFVKILFTAILESGIDLKESSKYFFGEMNFYQPTCSQFLLPIIKDYIGSNFESELQCLYALTDVNYKYGNPPGFVYDIIKELHERKIVSAGAILAWHAGTNQAKSLGHREAVMNFLSKPFSFKFENDDNKQQSTSSKEKK